MMMSPATPPPSHDFRLEMLRAVVELAALVRDAGPQLTAALAELDEREQSVTAREVAVAAREERIRLALRGMS